MQRITITIDDDLLETIDAVVARRGYSSRSEAVRDLVRDAAAREQAERDGAVACFAALSYVYDHETRDLARRLTHAHHHRHDLSVSTLHVHVSDEECLEVAVLRGTVDDVRALADEVVTQRGVRLGNLHIITAPPAGGPDGPGAGPSRGHHHPHGHDHDHRHD